MSNPELYIVDMHTHILPGIDDGSKNWDMTMEMLKMSWERGVRKIVATPHYLPWRPEITPDQIKSLCQEAEERCQKELGYPMKIYPGQEIFYHLDIVETLKKQKAQTMNDSKFVLVEFDTDIPWRELKYAVQTILRGGYQPILAHIERYDCLRERGRVEELLNLHPLLQINIRSLSGGFFDPRAKWCHKQISEGKIHFLGSDMHNISTRAPYNKKGLEWMQKKIQPAKAEELLRLHAEEYFQLK